MPIYEYRCAACGFEKEYLQKLSDAPIAECERCGKPSMTKLVSAAGFQLKGSGWYVTDFKNNGAKKDKPESKAEGGSNPAAAKGDNATGGDAGGKPAGDIKPSSEAKTSAESKSSGEARTSGDTKSAADSGAGSGSGSSPAP
jgi:putative FmdB family regulatory protein